MAQMIPNRLSEEVRSNPGREAEVAVFDALRAQLDASVTVLYSVEWNAPLNEGRPAQDGEADFVICDPERGFLVLEVKGGIISFDPDREQWLSTSRSGYVNEIPDPIKQARKSCYGLIKRLRKLLSLPGSMMMSHAVVLPHCLMRIEDLPGSTVPELTIDGSAMTDLRNRIEQAYAYWRNGAELRGPAFDEILAGLRRIHHWPVAGYRNISLEIAEHRSEFDRLTDDQLRVVDTVAGNRRLLVRGCAGSGKTFLARRLATKRSSAGERVLVLCFNNLLGSLLEEELGGLPQVTATNFHRFCERLSRGTGATLPEVAEPGAAYYQSLADVARDIVVSGRGPRFDTIIVDEAQDFEPDWWRIVESLLAGDDASLTAFIDANQLLYGADRGVPQALGGFARVDLGDNVRNTMTIHREALRFYQGDPEPSARGPEGMAPIWIEADSSEEQRVQLDRILSHLVYEEKVSPADIAILTPKGATSTSLRNLEEIGKWRLTPIESRTDDAIGWSTIRKFKGLESPVVVITELGDDLARSERMRELIYVGITRARDCLVMIGSKGMLSLLRGESVPSAGA